MDSGLKMLIVGWSRKNNYNPGKNWLCSKRRLLHSFSEGRGSEAGPPILTTIIFYGILCFLFPLGPDCRRYTGSRGRVCPVNHEPRHWMECGVWRTVGLESMS